MRIDKNKQRIAAAATAEENLETRPTGRMNPPTEPEAFQAWLNETRTKACTNQPKHFILSPLQRQIMSIIKSL